MEYWLLALGSMMVGAVFGFFLCAMLTAAKTADAWNDGYYHGILERLEEDE